MCLRGTPRDQAHRQTTSGSSPGPLARPAPGRTRSAPVSPSWDEPAAQILCPKKRRSFGSAVVWGSSFQGRKSSFWGGCCTFVESF